MYSSLPRNSNSFWWNSCSHSCIWSSFCFISSSRRSFSLSKRSSLSSSFASIASNSICERRKISHTFEQSRIELLIVLTLPLSHRKKKEAVHRTAYQRINFVQIDQYRIFKLSEEKPARTYSLILCMTDFGGCAVKENAKKRSIWTKNHTDLFDAGVMVLSLLDTARLRGLGIRFSCEYPSSKFSSFF